MPNWFLNASSAIVGVPFSIFFIATLIGLVPYSAILINMGLALDQITTIGHDWNVSNNFILSLPSLLFANIEHVDSFLPRVRRTHPDLPHEKRR